MKKKREKKKKEEKEEKEVEDEHRYIPEAPDEPKNDC